MANLDIQTLPSLSVPEWLASLSTTGGNFGSLLAASQRNQGESFRHTIREICQQPATWSQTARRMAESAVAIRESRAGCERFVFTGSGSSQYAGECVVPGLRAALQRPVDVLGGGEILISRSSGIPSGLPALCVSLARSGESPESVAAVRILLHTEPLTKHLILTCNAEGRLARDFAADPRVQVVLLGDEVHDRSLVMTSSFTNLSLAARFVGWMGDPAGFVELGARLDAAGQKFLARWPDELEEFVSGDIHRIVFLGSGCRFSAARESALKVLEMSDGRIATVAESYLGLRHGPMCFIDDRTLVVCFLSADPVIQAYERDVIRELDAKRLGCRKLLAGIGLSGAAADLQVDYDFAGMDAEDVDLVLLDVMIGQILGFHRCRQEGLRPDSPSAAGVINRVVAEFPIHTAPELAG